MSIWSAATAIFLDRMTSYTQNVSLEDRLQHGQTIVAHHDTMTVHLSMGAVLRRIHPILFLHASKNHTHRQVHARVAVWLALGLGHQIRMKDSGIP